MCYRFAGLPWRPARTSLDVTEPALRAAAAGAHALTAIATVPFSTRVVVAARDGDQIVWAPSMGATPRGVGGGGAERRRRRDAEVPAAALLGACIRFSGTDEWRPVPSSMLRVWGVTGASVTDATVRNQRRIAFESVGINRAMAPSGRLWGASHRAASPSRPSDASAQQLSCGSLDAGRSTAAKACRHGQRRRLHVHDARHVCVVLPVSVMAYPRSLVAFPG